MKFMARLGVFLIGTMIFSALVSFVILVFVFGPDAFG